MMIAGILFGSLLAAAIFMVFIDKPKMFVIAMLGIIAIWVGLTFAAHKIPNPWIRHEVRQDGQGYYLFCLPVDLPGDVGDRSLYPNLDSDWCNRIASNPTSKVNSVIIEVEEIIDSGCTIEGPGSTFIANAPGQQAAETMMKVYQANNPDGFYKVVCQ